MQFDYRGHGASEGRFEDGCIGDWRDDALSMLDETTTGSVVLVGSSMGAWIMLLAALARPERVRGLVGIASAPDFTHDLVAPRLTPADRAQLDRDGLLLAPSAYGEPLPITRRLLEDGPVTAKLCKMAIWLGMQVAAVARAGSQGLSAPSPTKSA